MLLRILNGVCVCVCLNRRKNKTGMSEECCSWYVSKQAFRRRVNTQAVLCSAKKRSVWNRYANKPAPGLTYSEDARLRGRNRP